MKKMIEVEAASRAKTSPGTSPLWETLETYAFALSVPHAKALRIRDDVGFFQAVQAVLAKRAPGEARPEEELDRAVRQIISRAVTPEGVVDIFAAAGLAKPDISILSEEFLSEVRGMPQRNLAVELLQKLLKGELRMRRRKNLV
jgi:type I restriction enzyme, R subunit